MWLDPSIHEPGRTSASLAGFVHPFKPVVDESDRPVRPRRLEDRVMGHLFDAGIDRRSASLGPRPLSPVHRLSQEQLVLYLKKRNLGHGRDVVKR